MRKKLITNFKCYRRGDRECQGGTGGAARGGFTEKMTCEVGEGAGGEEVRRQSHPGRGKGGFKGLGAGGCLHCSKTSGRPVWLQWGDQRGHVG